MGKGSLGCGGECAKCFLFLFNIIFWICGAAILGVGIWLAVDPNAWDYVEIINEGGMEDPLLEVAVYTMIGIGAFMFLVGFTGCCGACKENSCLLYTYITLVTLTMLAQITAAILAAVFRGEINDSIRDGMQVQVQEHYGDHDYSETLTLTWDEMQKDMECCGSINYVDYKDSYYHEETGNLVPASCCVTGEDGESPVDYDKCKADASDEELVQSEHLYTTGCYSELKSAINEYSDIIMGVLFAIAGLELLGLLLACCLKGEISKDKNYTV